jgi:hypothetical protein
MKTSLDILSFKLLLLFGTCLFVSCGRQTSHEPESSNAKRNDVPNNPLADPAAPTNHTGASVHATIRSNDAVKLASLAKTVQTKRATKEVNAADKAMQEFIAQWRPIGKQPTELERLLGKPDERTADYLDYRFDTGETGWSWVFQLSSDTITNFFRMRIN